MTHDKTVDLMDINQVLEALSSAARDLLANLPPMRQEDYAELVRLSREAR